MKAKHILLALLLILCRNTQAQIKVDTLTNEKVIKLSKLGLKSSVLINKIQTSYNKFDVSTDALIKLSDSGVSAEVINTMMSVYTKEQLEAANQKDINDPKTMRRTGIYFYNSQNTSKLINRVDPTVTSTSKSGGFGTFVAQAYTYGIAKSKVKSSIAGKNSRIQITDASPVFYFYFENNANPKADDWFFATATSPNEFVVIKMDQKKDGREIVVGTDNAYSSSSGISNKVKIDFEYEEIADGIYKVFFKQPIQKGEYCFLYASSTPTQYSNNKIWDFGILNDKK